MARKVHVFDNGVRVYDDHLIPVQRERYAKRNVHEAEEEDVFTELIRNLPADGCYLNIGCAIGYYPLLAKRLVPGLTIHAVEPLVRHQEFFDQNIRLNGLRPADFTVHERPVAATEGKAQFLEQDYGSALLRGGPPRQVSVKGLFKKLLGVFGIGASAGESRAGRTIETTTLDALVDAIGRTVNLVQMDVQGLEADVLCGGGWALRAGRVETFLIGTHGQEVHRECAEELGRHGYTIEFSEPDTKEQPDGILVASKGLRRFGPGGVTRTGASCIAPSRYYRGRISP